MDKIATSIFRSMGAKLERRARTTKAANKIGDELSNLHSNPDRYLKAQDTYANSSRKLRRTEDMANGKLAKKVKGTAKNIKKKLNVKDFFSKKKSGFSGITMG